MQSFSDWCDFERLRARDEAFKKLKKNCSSHKATVKKKERKKRR